MKKSIFAVLALVMVVLMAVMGCAPQAAPNTPSDDVSAPPSQAQEQQPEVPSDDANAAEKVYKIGVTTQAWKHEFLKNLVNAFQEADAEMPNVELILVDSNDDIQKQLDDVDTLIAQGVDGIILNALSFEGTSSAVEACKAAGIPVVEVISYTENEDYATFVGTDVKQSGLMAGELAAELLGGKGRVFMIEGIMGHTAQINRGAGIEEALAKYPDITLVEKQCGEFNKDKAISVTEAWLTKYDDIDVIVAHNDGMALGAMNACIAAGRTEIKIIGIDGDFEALKGILDGTYAGTILDYCEKEAKLAVEEMVSILDGNAPKGKILVDYVYVKTAEEAQSFMDLRK